MDVDLGELRVGADELPELLGADLTEALETGDLGAAQALHRLVPLLLGLAITLRERVTGRIRPVTAPATSAAALLFVALPLLAGCSVTPPRSGGSEQFRNLVADVVRRETTQAELRDMPPRSLVPPAPTLDAELASRADELDRLGGDQAFGRESADLGLDLQGDRTARDPIGLATSVRTAVEHGLGIQLARLGPEIAETLRAEAEAEFDLEFFSSAAFQKTDEPTRVPVLGGVVLGRPTNASEQERVSAGVRKRLATGATIAAETRFERFENDTRGIDFDPDPAYTATVSVGITQPLLRGRGAAFATADLALAENDRAREELVLRSEVITLSSAVEEAYWELAFAEEQVRVQERLLAQGEEVRRVLAERSTFDVRPASLADASATVEERRAALVTARRNLRGASDTLKALLDDPGRPVGGESVLETAESLPANAPEFEVNLASAIATALAERPEIEAAVIAIDDAELRERVAKNLRQPILDLQAEVGLVGLDDDFGEATRDWTANRYVDGLIGLTFEVPIGNRGPKAAERRARLERSSAEIALRRTVDFVVEEVKIALRDVRTQEELLVATRTLRFAQSENLRALLAEEESRAALTPEFLSLKFLRQERLAAARIQEMAARASVRQAIARFRRAIGALPPLQELSESVPPRE